MTKEEHQARIAKILTARAEPIADAASEIVKSRGIPFKYAVQCAAVAAIAFEIDCLGRAVLEKRK